MRLQNRRVFGAGVLALGAALVLAGCGAGQITQTDTQEPAVNGTLAQVKTLSLRNAAVQYPAQGAAYQAGASAPLTLTIVNQGKQDDALVSVTSDAASGTAQLGGSKAVVAGHALVIGAHDAVESTTEKLPSSSASSAPTSSGAPSSSSSSSSSPSSSAAPSSTAGGDVVGSGTVVLPGLKNPLWPGQTIKVTFVFQNAGPITIELPVAAPAHVRGGEAKAEGH
ncbi:hypothetical protein [Amycolatopsis sp. NPDC059021]|uniref:hypothetical protein n=1 Tax=Amycolatopsis sp. NPDC059021 TaxID=3346704 RepID=UPI00367347AC